MTSDTFPLMWLSPGALLVVWLVFSIFKRVMGLIFLGAVAVGCFILWTNPAVFTKVTDTLQGVIG